MEQRTGSRANDTNGDHLRSLARSHRACVAARCVGRRHAGRGQSQPLRHTHAHGTRSARSRDAHGAAKKHVALSRRQQRACSRRACGGVAIERLLLLRLTSCMMRGRSCTGVIHLQWYSSMPMLPRRGLGFGLGWYWASISIKTINHHECDFIGPKAHRVCGFGVGWSSTCFAPACSATKDGSAGESGGGAQAAGLLSLAETLEDR